MSGPGIYITHPICPDCYRVVECKVEVTADCDTRIISGIEEHKRICDRRFL